MKELGEIKWPITCIKGFEWPLKRKSFLWERTPVHNTEECLALYHESHVVVFRPLNELSLRAVSLKATNAALMYHRQRQVRMDKTVSMQGNSVRHFWEGGKLNLAELKKELNMCLNAWGRQGDFKYLYILYIEINTEISLRCLGQFYSSWDSQLPCSWELGGKRSALKQHIFEICSVFVNHCHLQQLLWIYHLSVVLWTHIKWLQADQSFTRLDNVWERS